MIHADDAALVADLERRLGGQVLHHRVKDIDYVRDIMVVDVRLPGRVRRSYLTRSFGEQVMAVRP